MPNPIGGIMGMLGGKKPNRGSDPSNMTGVMDFPNWLRSIGIGAPITQIPPEQLAMYFDAYNQYMQSNPKIADPTAVAQAGWQARNW